MSAYTVLECRVEKLAKGMSQIEELLGTMQQHSEMQTLVQLPDAITASHCLSLLPTASLVEC